jgi:predicted small lipoprotein YifL
MVFRAHPTRLRHLTAAALLVGLAGCRDAPPATYPVTGRLTIRGQPVAGADLWFFESDGRAPGMARPYATTDADGRFRLSTYGMNDGAPAGEYRVAVSWKGPLRGIPPDQRDAMPELLPPRFSDASTSGIRVQIEPEENTLAPIDLTP